MGLEGISGGNNGGGDKSIDVRSRKKARQAGATINTNLTNGINVTELNAFSRSFLGDTVNQIGSNEDLNKVLGELFSGDENFATNPEFTENSEYVGLSLKRIEENYGDGNGKLTPEEYLNALESMAGALGIEAGTVNRP